MRLLLLVCLVVALSGAMTWSRGLVGYWPFEGTRLDASGNGRTAYGVNTVYGPGVFGQCDTFNGTTYDTIRDADALSFSDGSNDLPYTMTAWVRIKATGTVNYILAKRTAALGEWGFSIRKSGGVGMVLYSGGGNSYFMAETSAAGTVPAGTWTHVAVSYNGNKDTSGVTLYINGKPVSKYPYSSGYYVGMQPTSSIVYVGVLTDRYYNTGRIDEVSIWNRVLSARDIRRVMMGMSPIE